MDLISVSYSSLETCWGFYFFLSYFYWRGKISCLHKGEWEWVASDTGQAYHQSRSKACNIAQFWYLCLSFPNKTICVKRSSCSQRDLLHAGTVTPAAPVCGVAPYRHMGGRHSVLAGRPWVKGKSEWQCWYRVEGGESGLISVTPQGPSRCCLCSRWAASPLLACGLVLALFYRLGGALWRQSRAEQLGHRLALFRWGGNENCCRSS